MRFTPSTNYNQFLPCPGLNYSRYGIVYSERLGYQLWQRPLKMASIVYETEISSGEAPLHQTPPHRIASLLHSLFQVPLARDLSNASPLRANFGMVLRHSFENCFYHSKIDSGRAITDYSAMKVQPLLSCLSFHFCLEPQFLEPNQGRQK